MNERAQLFYIISVQKIALFILGAALVLSLLSLAIVASGKREYIVIENGIARYIGQTPGTVRTKEVQMQVKSFIDLYYNWTPNNISEHNKQAIIMMSDRLAYDAKDGINNTIDKAKNTGLAEIFVIESMELLSTQPYKVKVVGTQQLQTDRSQLQTKYAITFELAETNRTTDNPAGLLISSIHEEELR